MTKTIHISEIDEDYVEHLRNTMRFTGIYEDCDEHNYFTKYKGEIVCITGTIDEFKQRIDD